MTASLKGEISNYLSKKNPYYKNFSNELLNHLELKYPTLPNIKSKWLMLKNNMTEADIPKCGLDYCEEKAKWNIRTNVFDLGCCMNHNKRLTSIKNFGTEHPNQNKKQIAKVKKSVQDKYGVDSIAQLNSTKKKIKKTTKDKYGVDSIAQLSSTKEKIKSTMIARHGVEYAQQSEDIRGRTKETNLSRFGVEEALSDPTIRAKGNETNLERYGSIFPMRNVDVKAKKLNTIIERYDSYSPSSDPVILKKIQTTYYTKYYNNVLMKNKLFIPMFTLEEYNGTINEKRRVHYEWKCISCNNKFTDTIAAGNIPTCPTCFPQVYNISKGEMELYESIEVSNKERSCRNLIGQKEIDIYLPDHKLGIEFNGLYWHSEQKGKGKYYHLDKTLMAENNGFDLFHVFENEWINSKELVMDIINRRIGNIHVTTNLTKTTIKSITNEVKSIFLTTNSIGGNDLFTKDNRGIYLGDELLAVMSISKLKNGFEIRQYVLKIGEKFEFGNPFKLLFHSFNISGDKVVYYTDRRFNIIDDTDVVDSGFTFEGSTEPSMFYSKKNNDLISSATINSDNILQHIKRYDSVLTIKENMVANGYLTIWDCGKLVFKIY